MSKVSLRQLVFPRDTGLEDDHLVSPAAERDSRPEVLYRPTGTIIAGYRAVVISLNHYNSDIGENGITVMTGTVIAYDKVTGAFETKRTRYVLDKSYAH